MKEKMHYSEIFEAVEKAAESNATQLYCSECGQGFYKITFVGLDEADFIIEDGLIYKCSDHITYDLLVNPEVTQSVIFQKNVSYNNPKLKTRVEMKSVDAHLFIPNRYN